MSQVSQEHILLLANEAQLLAVVDEALSSYHGTIKWLADPAEAVSFSETHACSLLCVFHEPPAIDAIRLLQSNASLPPMLVIVEPGAAEDAAAALEAGAADFLIRPDQQSLVTLLPHLVDRIIKQDALIMERRGALEALAKRNDHLNALNNTGQDLTSTHELEPIIERLLRALVSLVDADGSSIWLWSDSEDATESPWLVCEAVYHRDLKPDLLKRRLRAGEGIVGWVVEHNKPVFLMSPASDDRFATEIDAMTGFSTESLLAVPVRTPDAVLGVLEAVNKRSGPFDGDDVAFAETLAAWAAIALENANLVSELRTRTEDLHKRNEDLDAFGHTVAHDLKTPLALVGGYSELLADNWEQLSVEERERCLQGILNGSAKMETIIEELITLARLRESSAAIETLDMQQIIAEVKGHLAYLIDRYDATIIEPDGWPVAMGHAPWVEQIWVNYVTNAMKYGGRPPIIELGAELLPNRTIRFWVQDNGPGLSPDEQERLFVPFSQVGDGVSGHGLGLSIVSQIVARLNGRVGISSQVGAGSRFSFTLPAGPHSS